MAATNAPKLQRVSESVTQTEGVTVDLDAGIIRGVKVLGEYSRNGRRYADQAMAESLSLYEGIAVNIDHRYDDSERPMVEGFGTLRNVRKADDGIYGDLHFLKSHPCAAMICERAERFPESFGMSHDAQGELIEIDGEWVVAKLLDVESVDIVSRPATTKGLFEAEQKPMKRTLREAVAASPKHQWAKLLEMAMEEDPKLAEMEYEVEEMDGEPDAGDQVAMAFRSLVMSVLDDESLDVAAKTEKLQSLLQMESDAKGVVAGDAPTETPEAEGGDDKMEKQMESLRRKVDELGRLLEAKSITERIDAILAEHGAKRGDLTESQTRLLADVSDEARARDLIDSWQLRESSAFGRRVAGGRAEVGTYDEIKKQGSLASRSAQFRS